MHGARCVCAYMCNIYVLFVGLMYIICTLCAGYGSTAMCGVGCVHEIWSLGSGAAGRTMRPDGRILSPSVSLLYFRVLMLRDMRGICVCVCGEDADSATA